MNTCEVIARFLHTTGIRHVFGYPGESNVELIEQLRRRGIQFVLGSREGTAGLMAEAYGVLTGRPGVCLSTLGPGATNLVNAVANAHLDRTPMIAISGQMDSKRSPYFTHQVIDHNRLFSPITKWHTDIGPRNVGTVMRKAYRVAMAERPGPVHVTTPMDTLDALAEDDAILVPPVAPARHQLTVIAGDSSADPVRTVAGARRPVILFGASAMRAGAGPEIAALAERIGCPVLASPMAKGTVAEDHPLFTGVLDMACGQVLRALMDQADLILAVGFDAVELIHPWTTAAPVMHIDSVPNTDQVYLAAEELIGPVPQILDELKRAVPDAEKWTMPEVAKHRDELRRRYLAGRVPGKLNPSDVVEIVRGTCGRMAIATADVGSHKLLVGQGWSTYRPHGMLMTNGLSSMGFALPAAIAARLLAPPDQQVVCFTGDGGLAMVQGELRLAATLKLGMTVVVFCDDSLNRINMHQHRHSYPAVGTRLDATDIEALARSMDCDGVMVESEDGLAAALNEGGSDRPLVIGARIDAAQYRCQY